MFAALRYTRGSAALRRGLLRAFLFFAFASAPWALLPLVAREVLGGSAGFYGAMLGGIGAGAVAGALLFPRLRARLGTNRLVLAATFMFSAAALGLSGTATKWVALGLMPPLGLAWLAVLTTLNVTAQSTLPDWVRGRGLALYTTVFFGSMAFGSLVWGQLAQLTSIEVSLAVAASAGAGVALWLARLPLPEGDEDLSPSLHWPEPAATGAMGVDAGPVMVLVEYRVNGSDAPAFASSVAALGTTRRRDGAYAWGVFQDSELPERFVEYFIVESWLEHMRQHQRVSHADERLQAAVRRLHAGPQPPCVSHLVAPGWLGSGAVPPHGDQPLIEGDR
jgi:MFS family permease